MENDEKNWRRPKMEDEIRERVINEAHERIDRKMRRRLRRRDSYAGLIPGAVILAIGVIFLLDSLGYAHAKAHTPRTQPQHFLHPSPENRAWVAPVSL